MRACLFSFSLMVLILSMFNDSSFADDKCASVSHLYHQRSRLPEHR